MVKPAVVCGSETWAVTAMDVKTLGTGERIILKRIYRPSGRARNMESKD